MTTFKIYFSEENIRRFRFDEIPTYENFIIHLEQCYPKFHAELHLKYVDGDGDKITISSQLEWEEMLNELGGEPIRIYVEDGEGNYFKDGPEPEFVQFYDENDSQFSADFLSALRDNVPSCLASLFQRGKIIPSHIPSFLKEAISTKYIEENTVDLDINVQKLIDSLHSRAIELLDSVNIEDLRTARDYLVACLSMVPDHITALYNLACAESLLGNVNEALYYLESSIEHGYRNLSHMLQDADLQNIKDTEAFQILSARLASMLDMANVETAPEEKTEFIPEPEVVPEPEPVPVTPAHVELSASILPLKNQYSEELQLLSEMGFTADPDVMLLLLEQHSGNVDEVAQFLLGFQ